MDKTNKVLLVLNLFIFIAVYLFFAQLNNDYSKLQQCENFNLLDRLHYLDKDFIVVNGTIFDTNYINFLNFKMQRSSYYNLFIIGIMFLIFSIIDKYLDLLREKIRIEYSETFKKNKLLYKIWRIL